MEITIILNFCSKVSSGLILELEGGGWWITECGRRMGGIRETQLKGHYCESTQNKQTYIPSLHPLCHQQYRCSVWQWARQLQSTAALEKELDGGSNLYLLMFVLPPEFLHSAFLHVKHIFCSLLFFINNCSIF